MRPPSRSRFIRSLVQAFNAHHIKRHIKKEETTPDCPATMPRGPGATPLSRTRLPAALRPAATPAPAATTQRVSPTAASTTGEGPVTSTDPDYWATLSFSTHCTRDPLNKYCYCWSAVVVIPNNAAAVSFIGDPDVITFIGDPRLQLTAW